MKKLIAAFAVLAIVGSALAFKPFNGQNLYLKNPVSGTCDVLQNGKYVTDPTQTAIQGRLNTAGACQTIKVVRDDD